MKTNKLKMKVISVLLFSLIFLVACSTDSEDDDKIFNPEFYTYVPDDNFEQLLINQKYDDKLDDYVLTSNISNVTSLLFTSGYYKVGFEVFSSEISDFTGIEDFVSLETFDCSELNLTKLNLTNNVALKSLNCSSNSLEMLDLSNLINLENVNCSYNNLEELKLNSSVLEYLSCNNNNLVIIDIAQSNELINLNCFSNKLSSLDISHNINLELLQAGDNLFERLDISENVALTYVSCSLNPLLTCIQVNEDQLNQNWKFCSKELFSLNCD